MLSSANIQTHLNLLYNSSNIPYHGFDFAYHVYYAFCLADLFITTNNLHTSSFSSFNLFIFTEEDGATINNEDRK